MSSVSKVLNLDLSGVRVRVTGPDRALIRLFEEGWAPFLSEPATPDLNLAFQVEGAPPRDESTLIKEMRFESRDGRVAITTGEGRIDLDPDGRARAVIRNGGERFRFFGLQNLLLAALARVLPGRGMVLVHGAGIELAGTGIALVGPEGSGKTTWSRLAGEAGAGILSDDLLIVAVLGGKAFLLGSPFRADRLAPMGPGRWPLGMLLSARHARRPELAPGNRLAFQALLSANLPFMADRAGRDAGLNQVLDDILDAVPCRVLSFERSGSFVPLLREAIASGTAR